jgi:hypothetical protein
MITTPITPRGIPQQSIHLWRGLDWRTTALCLDGANMRRLKADGKGVRKRRSLIVGGRKGTVGSQCRQ